MQIYLAGRYSRRVELCGYRAQLEDVGHNVTSRWLDGKHQVSTAGVPIGGDGEALVENGSTDCAAQLREHFALEDVADLFAADVVINFTEAPRTTGNRGGRHVEFGMALGINRFLAERGALHEPFRLIVIGHRENLFHWLPEIEFFETWEECFAALNAAAVRAAKAIA